MTMPIGRTLQAELIAQVGGLQAFNWESANSGNWWGEVERAGGEIARAGFSVAWLPPPTQSVSRQVRLVFIETPVCALVCFSLDS